MNYKLFMIYRRYRSKGHSAIDAFEHAIALCRYHGYNTNSFQVPVNQLRQPVIALPLPQ